MKLCLNLSSVILSPFCPGETRQSAWWRLQLEIFSALLLLSCGEFTVHWWIPLTKASDAEFEVFFDLRLNKRLSKQSRCRWFEMAVRSLWRHTNGLSPSNIHPRVQQHNLYFRVHFLYISLHHRRVFSADERRREHVMSLLLTRTVLMRSETIDKKQALK